MTVSIGPESMEHDSPSALGRVEVCENKICTSFLLAHDKKHNQNRKDRRPCPVYTDLVELIEELNTKDVDK